MYKHLTQYELYYIWQNLVNKDDYSCLNNTQTVPGVAAKLGKHRSTIYRALKYIKATLWKPTITGSKVLYERISVAFPSITAKVLRYITEKLKVGWSPEVISGRLYKDKRKRISFKTIYRYIWHDKSTGGKLFKLLPHQGKRYKYGSGKRSPIKNRTDISLRPQIVESKSRIGDLEGDTIVGKRGGDTACLLTIVDRKSKYCLIRKIANKSAAAVEEAMSNCYDNSLLPFLTVTYDNGTEFANHQNISANIGCDIYFARPYRSSDRGLNEHTNGLIRRYFPKKTDFGNVTDDEIEFVQNALNNRPRKSLGFLTPNEVLNKHLAKAYKKIVAA